MKRVVTCAAAAVAFTGVLGSLSLMLDASAPIVPSGNWAAIQTDLAQPAASLTEARAGATATRLDDGRVLIVAGVNAYGTNPLASAEVFDGARFAAVAAMRVARSGHTAIKLADGRVLVAGGMTSDGSATRSAELFDPSTNSWSAAGELATARTGHTATLLPDGRVLVAGGSGSDDAGRTLEIFDPSTGGFGYVGAFLSTARAGHAAATLGNGDVLIVGGRAGDNATATTDVFRVGDGTLVAGPSMGSARFGHSLTLMPDGTVLVAGGSNAEGDVAAAELFVGSKFMHAGTLGEARRHHLAILLPDNGQVLIVGGTSGESPAVSAELYRPWATGFVATGAPASLHDGAAGVALATEGLALLAGGPASNKAELYGFATLIPERLSYAAGSSITVRGSNWEPGETVAIKLQSSEARDEHTVYATADKQGRIATSELTGIVEDAASFVVTASGARSQARATFSIRAARTKTMSAESSASAALAPAPGTPGPLVWTSKDDYVPEEIVDMWGSGWSPGETVTLTLFEVPQAHPSRTFSVVADQTGAFLFEEFKPEPHHAGVKFILNAVGSASRLQAQAEFWDSIAIGASSTNSNGGGATSSQNLTLSVPSVSAGDVLVAQIAVVDAIGGTAICPPGGWSSILDNNFGTSIRQHTFWFRATAAAAPSAHTWQIRNGCGAGSSAISGKGAIGGVIRFTGVVASGSPVDVSAAGGGSSSGPFNAPSVTTTVANARILRFFGAFKNKSNLITGTGLIYGAGSSNNSKERFVAGFDGGNQAAAGATGVFTATFSESAEFVSQTVALKEAPTGPTTLAFTSAAHTWTVHQCFGAITVETQNASNQATNVTTNTTVNLASDGTGSFFGTAGCGSTPITSVEITTGNSSATFYYKATLRGDGTHNLTAAATGLTAASQEQTITKATLVVTPDPQEITFGEADPTFAFAYTGFLGGEDEDDLTTQATCSVPSAATPRPAGNYTISCTAGTDDNYDFDVTATATLTVKKATPTVTATGGTFTYDATSHAGSCSVTGVGAADLGPLPPTYDPGGATAPIDAGTYIVHCDYAASQNYEAASDTGTLTIDRATPTVSATGGTFTYDANPHAGSCSVSGVNSITLTAPAGTYSPGGGPAPVNAGSYTVTCDYAGSTNYEPASASATLTINRATPTVIATGGTFTYDAAGHAGSCAVSGVAGADLGPVAPTYDPGGATTPVNAGSYTVHCDYAESQNYNAASDTDTLTINRANAVTNVNGYTGVYDAQAHGATGTAKGVQGETLAGLNLGASFTDVPGGTANWTFTDVTGNYNNASGSVAIVISRANATIVVQGFTGTFDGNPHGATGSSVGVLGEALAGLNLGATFMFVPGGTATWTFTDVTGNYNHAAGEVNIVILTACSLFNGFHPPLGGSVETGGGGSFGNPARAFKLSSTIPIKFSATCFGAPLTTGIQTLQAIKYSNATTAEDPIDATPNDEATDGNQFKLTGTDWHFNMATKSLGANAQGKWLLKARLFDGSTYSVWIEIKK